MYTNILPYRLHSNNIADYIFLNTYSVSYKKGEVIEKGAHISQFSMEGGANRRGCSFGRFSKKRVLIKGESCW